jgi:folate-binding protein YgfZ
MCGIRQAAVALLRPSQTKAGAFMTHPKIAELSDRAVIRLSGEDTRKLLQKLITVDFDDVSPTRAGYGALLTPQGKIMFDFFVAEQGGAYLFDCAGARKDELIKRLTFYRLRAKMDIEDISPDFKVMALWGGDVETLEPEAGAAAESQGGVLYRDPRVAETGMRAMVPRTVICAGQDVAEADYHAHRIAIGLADSMADLASGDLFPHEANFDQFHGVDFAKGCYVGQEVVSRMEHRGTGARKRIVPVIATEGTIEAGDVLSAGGKAIGEVLSSSGQQALALVRLDRAESALGQGDMIQTAAGYEVVLQQPAWAQYRVPGRSALA